MAKGEVEMNSHKKKFILKPSHKPKDCASTPVMAPIDPNEDNISKEESNIRIIYLSIASALFLVLACTGISFVYVKFVLEHRNIINVVQSHKESSKR